MAWQQRKFQRHQRQVAVTLAIPRNAVPPHQGDVGQWRLMLAWLGLGLLGGLFVGLVASSQLSAQAPFDQKASWATPTYAEARAEALSWLDDLAVDEATRGELQAIWPEKEDEKDVEEEANNDAGVDGVEAEEGERAVNEVELLDKVQATIRILKPESAPLLERMQGPRTRGGVPTFGLLGDPSVHPRLRAHLRLLYGRWLVQQEMYDEALEHFGSLEPREVLAPATLLFHQSVAHHRLLQKEECLPKLVKLMENESRLPRRYREVSRLMEADLRPLKEDSLDEIARIMDNVTRRLNLGRAGQRVRQEEDDVIAKLDKMIEQLEQQQQQQQQQQAGGGSQGQTPRSPNLPMEDSRAAGGSGPGNVTPRSIGRGAGWGDLPPKEREEAMQEITKNLPAHYRDVIEEYFRKLARTSD